MTLSLLHHWTDKFTAVLTWILRCACFERETCFKWPEKLAYVLVNGTLEMNTWESYFQITICTTDISATKNNNNNKISLSSEDHILYTHIPIYWWTKTSGGVDLHLDYEVLLSMPQQWCWMYCSSHMDLVSLLLQQQSANRIQYFREESYYT